MKELSLATDIATNDTFAQVVLAEDVAVGKPAPNIFLLAAKWLEVAPEDRRVYEDSEAGLEAAHRASMRMIDMRGLWFAESQTCLRHS